MTLPLPRVVVAAIAAYALIGLVYATSSTAYFELRRIDQTDIASPWSGPMAFLAWFVPPAALWPWNLVGVHRVPELLVVCVYLATFGLFYLATARRSAPRRLKSSHPDHH